MLLFASKLQTECEGMFLCKPEFLHLITAKHRQNKTQSQNSVGQCVWEQLIPPGDIQWISRCSSASSRCDFTGCGELSAQLSPKQEGPALPSLLLSQDDAPPPVSPPALWSFSTSSFNSLQQILQHLGSLNQHIRGSRKFWLLQGGSGKGMEWGGKGGITSMADGSQISLVLTQNCSQVHSLKQREFFKGKRTGALFMKGMGAFKLTWSKHKQELSLKNQPGLLLLPKCCPKCHHPVLCLHGQGIKEWKKPGWKIAQLCDFRHRCV